LLSLGGVWALFRLGTWRFRDERLGLLVAGLLVLSPRFFAESFYNAKDLVFTAGFALGIYTLVRLLARPSGWRVLAHGLASAATIDIRILGLLLVPFTLGLLALRALRPVPTAGHRGRLLRAGLGYCAVVAAGTVAGWPYLWASPWANFSSAFSSLSHFAWSGLLLYGGELMPAADVPWHYAPVWISLTTPVAYQLAAVVGGAVAMGALVQHPWARLRTTAGQLDLLLLGWLLLPLALVIGFHSAIYDGWRHLYFIYPALLLLAVRWAGRGSAGPPGAGMAPAGTGPGGAGRGRGPAHGRAHGPHAPAPANVFQLPAGAAGRAAV
jgi:4-amino-4-deoxy-L-arabinose transferase-like glycosyltransferase